MMNAVSSKEEVLKEIVNIFKEEKGFDRLFSSFYEKYRSYGRLEKSIAVQLNKPSPEEAKAIGGLLGTDLSGRKSFTVRVQQLERALRKTRFGDWIDEIQFYEIVAVYFDSQLLSKKDELEQLASRQMNFFRLLRIENKNPELDKLLERILAKEPGTEKFHIQFKSDEKKFMRAFKTVCQGLQQLPDVHTYMPIFAANVTGDPHAFDFDTLSGRLLISVFDAIYTEQGLGGARKVESVEAKAELLYELRLLRDDTLNFASIFNLRGWNRDSEENQLLRGACLEQAPFHLPMKEVAKLSAVKACGRENVVFIVENSSVFSHLVSIAIEEKLDVSIMCGNGQVKLATLKLLDLFVASGGRIFYSGDFDPEGLLIGQKLSERYQGSFSFWHYSSEDYFKARSKKGISDHRMKQLGIISHPELMWVREFMDDCGLAGYQEKILDDLVDDLRCKV